MKDKVRKGAAGRAQAKTNDVISLTHGKDAPATKLEDDSSFPVKIQGAGVEPFEFQICGFWQVQDALTTLLSRDEVAPRSNLYLTFAGTPLDPLAGLQTIKGLKPGAVLRLVEEPFTARSARHHLARVLELLRASGPQDALREGRSPSLLDTLTNAHAPETSLPNGKSLKRSASNPKSEALNNDGAPPEYLLPGSSDRPLMALLPHSSQPEIPTYLRDLSLSSWDPPPGNRKLQGDFLYITVVTTEGQRCDVTSCPKGFFVNRSTQEVFDPRPSQSSPVCHCFTDLLCHISPAFKQAFTKSRHQISEVDMMPTPYQTLCWLGPPCATRTHKNTFSSLGVEDQPANQAPDWNEELQVAKDRPQTTLEERLQRERALLQVNSAFVRTVSQGAETVIEGFAEPVNGNPEDPAFLFGGLFMSRGAASNVFGGERGRRAAQRLELKGVQMYSDLQGLQGLHTLPTAIVDYRGVRLSAQGLAPGLEGTEQEEGTAPVSRGLLYGVNAGLQESPNRRRILELLAHAAKALSLQRHVVLAPNGHRVPLFTSVDTQGLLGADGRFYILDVFRTLPADANYCPEPSEVEQYKESCNGSDETALREGWPQNYQKDLGLPKSFPHSLCRLRPELMQTFIQHKHSQFTQLVREKLENNGGFEECATACDSRATEAVRAACQEVGSLSDVIFEMRFCPNIFSPGVSFPINESASVHIHEKLLREAAAFIITHQIPAFVEHCLQSNETPMDGASLKEALHERGINLRYLGYVLKTINQSKHKERLRHITRIVVGEILMRSTRRVFNSFLQGLDMPCLATAVSHFLCCLLVPHFTASTVGEDTKKKSRRRGRGPGASEGTTWSTLTANELWNQVCQDAVQTYNVSDSLGPGLNQLVDRHRLQKISLLREFCLKTGVQLRLRDYLFDSHSKPPIGPDDIINIFPMVKHIQMPTSDASKAFHAAQNYLQKGLMDQAYEQLKDATYLFGRVCDDLHPEACYCHSQLAKLAFLLGKTAEARSVQLRAVVISERVLGFDHPNTIHQYALLAVYVCAGGETNLAQKCLLRARLLLLTIHGEDHPYIARLDSCLGLLLTGDQAGKYLKNALRLNASFFGPTNLHTALTQHLVSQWLCSKGDYRGAMNHEKEALAAFTSLFDEDHPQTRCSKEFLCTITKQAVQVERSLRQAGPKATEQTVECLSPTSETVLEQMVLVTGIKKIAISDRYQEYKQKHKELKAAVTKELMSKAAKELSEVINGQGEPTQERGSGEEVPNGGGPAVVETNESQLEEKKTADTLGSANGHMIEEKTEVDGGEAEASPRVVLNTEEKLEDSADGDSSAANVVEGSEEGQCEQLDETKSDEVGESPKSKGTWADVVSNMTTAGETGSNCVESISVNGTDQA
ncbi:clustered mitochondria protein homolog [Corythoichthys intestinalis]|uniref:clustered mitochondria protein homolog n=1 Tax=Corythoichthys intestinalis TaxID=161448 RepID=UPI0025A5EADD|nr:clustered mitochondria protein homolog [Corythoichthys intestinalis]XP_057687399.1 clustered mitochondria protein homolog [Corythoichthys intestinalis]XP_057687400.1 clustered mitochondria protein homolog [Corythoichthys intestinalis]XP_061803915.1 clustered mitochondria protein homolog [Nerophis lumbriciformis]